MSERRAPVKDDYTVGWVCALPLEVAAAKGMLDEIHQDLPEQDISDHNSYILGQIHHHNIVIAGLPAGVYGTTPAATVANNMLRTFPSIRFGLMVGIGGAAPTSTQDIRLGDVVVSQPHGTSGGVIQFDRGKVAQKGNFQRTGSLNSPPTILLTALSRLQADHENSGNKIPLFLTEMVERYPKMEREYSFQGARYDQLYRATYDHSELNSTCEQCDAHELVQREHRKDTDPRIYYGNIASSNQVIKHGVTRDQLCEELDVLCFEMEAAGLMPDFPCLVIRGMCDYSDSHKNKRWQRYAAATAAGFAKELLGVISADRVRQEKAISHVSDPILQNITSNINTHFREHIKGQEIRYENERYQACHQSFKTSTYEQFKDNNPDRVPNTCRWVLEDERYHQWWQAERDDLLWISADPGCGKSVLARSLIDYEFQSTTAHTTCYFFFKDNEEQDSLATALCALLHQLFSARSQLLRYAIDSWDKNHQKLQSEVQELWRILLSAAIAEDAQHVTIVIDALDECREKDRQLLIRLLSSFYVEPSRPRTQSSCLKFLVTSRPYMEIEDEFQGIRLPIIRLRGELENDKIHEEINLVVSQKVAILADKNGLSQSMREKLEQKLLDMDHRTYLWLHLAIQDIERTFRRSLQPEFVSIESLLLPSSVEEAYEKILRRVPTDEVEVVAQIFHIIIGARRPLTTSEMAMTLGILRRKDLQSFAEFKISEGRLERIIRDLCGLFVFINHSRIYLIHQTAKEFLVQRGPKDVTLTPLWRHSFDPRECETIMARICVDYLSLNEVLIDKIRGERIYHTTEHGRRQLKLRRGHEIGILLPYSSEHWADHFRNACFELKDTAISKARELCRVESDQFQLWFPFLWQAFRQYDESPVMSDIRIVAFNGHDVILRMILDAESVDLEALDQGGRTALIWAAELGHEKVVEILLDMGAEVDAQGGGENEEDYGNALQAASLEGHQKVVEMLLDKGAEVNAQGGDYGNALQAASIGGHQTVVEMLLDKGAEVNAQGGDYGNALQAASSRGHQTVVEMLLDKGAEVNAQGGDYGNALQAASWGGHQTVVEMLLDKGAEVNAQREYYGNALQAASWGGHQTVVEMLLDKGAEVNAQGGDYGNALQAASWGGHQTVVEMLLDKGAEINAQGGRYDNAIRAASMGDHLTVVQILQKWQYMTTTEMQVRKRGAQADPELASTNDDNARKKARRDHTCS
ncbi:hypothetical protein GJ744_005519 [Endocarpon pusillum]|uniref:NACHT domain-containing protein n=1 Tax=Endocarpon pusillum TaxID=364733 RepID=A0A8H7E7D7_9EURO|nr:hypothetical protein GJ744_005519 [Endocarpon pusillum]